MLDRSKYASAEGLRRGGYVLADPDGDGDPEVILIATGSEVALAVAAHEKLIADGVRSRVVSLPVLGALRPPGRGLPRRGAAARDHGPRLDRGGLYPGLGPCVGEDGAKIGMHTFGSSAPLKDVQTKFGFTPEKVAEAAKEVLNE